MAHNKGLDPKFGHKSSAVNPQRNLPRSTTRRVERQTRPGAQFRFKQRSMFSSLRPDLLAIEGLGAAFDFGKGLFARPGQTSGLPVRDLQAEGLQIPRAPIGRSVNIPGMGLFPNPLAGISSLAAVRARGDAILRETETHKRDPLHSMNTRVDGPPAVDEFGLAMDSLLVELEHQMALARQAHEDGLEQIASVYDRDIAETVRRIGAAQGAQGDVDDAYVKYNALVDKYATIARETGADPEAYAANIDEIQREATEDVQGVFLSAEEAVADTLLLIGAQGDDDLTQALTQAVREFDDFAVDAIRDGLDNAETVMRLGVTLTDRMVDSIEADDELTSEMNRAATQARLGSYIEDLQRQKASIEASKADAIRQANEEFDASFGTEIDAPTLFDWAFDRWAETEGLDFQQRADLQSEFRNFFDGEGIRTREQMKTSLLGDLFLSNMELVALAPQNQAFWKENGLLNDVDEPLIDNIIKFIANHAQIVERISRGTSAGINTFINLNVTGIPDGDNFVPIFLPSEMDRFDDPLNTRLLDMFDMWNSAVSRADSISDEFQDTLSLNPTTGWRFPVVGGEGSYSNYFNKPHTKRDGNHMGIDVFAPRGSYIVSPVSGTVSRVISASSGGSTGNAVYIMGSNGIEYVFFHMDKGSNVKVGDSVAAGALIGLVGNSGSAQGTKPHAHFEMRKSGRWINPYDHLKASEGVGGTPSYSGGVTRGTTSSSTTGGSTSSPKFKNRAEFEASHE